LFCTTNVSSFLYKFSHSPRDLSSWKTRIAFFWTGYYVRWLAREHTRARGNHTHTISSHRIGYLLRILEHTEILHMLKWKYMSSRICINKAPNGLLSNSVDLSAQPSTDASVSKITFRPFSYMRVKFNSHYVNVLLNTWSIKCRLIACMSAQIRSNLWDESIKHN
jgi:hypothetical protein